MIMKASWMEYTSTPEEEDEEEDEGVQAAPP